jgi:hypothetical protein
MPAKVAFLIGNLRYFHIGAQSKHSFSERDDEKETQAGTDHRHRTI